MPEKSWKAVERRIARRLGGERNPLSGIQGGAGTHGDIIHSVFYGEIKHLQRAAILTLHAKTGELGRKEGKTPLTIIHKKGTEQYVVCIDLSDFEKLCLGSKGPF